MEITESHQKEGESKGEASWIKEGDWQIGVRRQERIVEGGLNNKTYSLHP